MIEWARVTVLAGSCVACQQHEVEHPATVLQFSPNGEYSQLISLCDDCLSELRYVLKEATHADAG